MSQLTKPLLDVRELKMYYPIHEGIPPKKIHELKAVDDVSFSVDGGETFGIVGESGCGKTTLGRCILWTIRPTAGQIFYQGNELTKLSDRKLRPYRREVQLIFQDPYSSLDPRQSIKAILRETIEAGKERIFRPELEERINEFLHMVGLDPYLSARYPHEMSGGQRQRVGIARALACNPKLIVCDEPVSALDVSIQAQIVNLFMDLQKKLGLTYVFIAHDLAVVRHISTRIAVMYLGKIVEITDSDTLYEQPLHPYTIALLSAIPIADYQIEQNRKRIMLRGDVPSPINRPEGCPFHPRCPRATDICKQESPLLAQVNVRQKVACFHI